MLKSLQGKLCPKGLGVVPRPEDPPLCGCLQAPARYGVTNCHDHGAMRSLLCYKLLCLSASSEHFRLMSWPMGEMLRPVDLRSKVTHVSSNVWVKHVPSCYDNDESSLGARVCHGGFGLCCHGDNYTEIIFACQGISKKEI